MGKHRLFGSLILALVLALIVSTAYADGGHGIAKAMSVQDAATDKLLALPDVVGTAIGHGPNNRPAIFVLTEKAGVSGIPTKIDGVPVIPKAVGKIEALARGGNPGKPGGGGGEDPVPVDPTGKFRPVPIGVSTGHFDITAGTIGARVIDGSGNVYALSNNHVYANENLATVGDNVLQPGPYDGGVNPTDAIGTLSAYVPIDFSGGSNRVDAAIAATSTSILLNSTPEGAGYGTPSSSTIGAVLNMKVMKYGRTTGLTKGSVWAINATVNVGYSTGVAKFVDQIIVSGGTFSAGGDSGSLVVADGKGRDKANKGKPVGLLFAGSSSTTVINPINEVLTSLGVSIDGN